MILKGLGKFHVLTQTCKILLDFKAIQGITERLSYLLQFRPIFCFFFQSKTLQDSFMHISGARVTLKGGVEGKSPPNHENLSFRIAKTAVQCIFWGKLTGSRTIWSTTVTEKKVTENFRGGKLFIHPPPKKSIKVISLVKRNNKLWQEYEWCQHN